MFTFCPPPGRGGVTGTTPAPKGAWLIAGCLAFLGSASPAKGAPARPASLESPCGELGRRFVVGHAKRPLAAHGERGLVFSIPRRQAGWTYRFVLARDAAFRRRIAETTTTGDARFLGLPNGSLWVRITAIDEDQIKGLSRVCRVSLPERGAGVPVVEG